MSCCRVRASVCKTGNPPTTAALLSPAVAQAVATRDDPSVAEGWVIAESRAGFEWDGELLRAAEVIVAKRAGSKDGADRGETE